MSGGKKLNGAEELGDFTTTARVIPISLLAMIIGALATGVAWALLKLIAVFTNLFFFQRLSAEAVSPAQNHLGLLMILVPVVGSLIIGLMARYGSERIRGHGIPEAIESILINGSRVEPKLAILTPPALGMLASAKPDPIPAAGRVNFPPPPSVQTVSSPPAPNPSASTAAPSSPAQPRREPLPAKAGTYGDQSLTRALGLKLGRVVIDAGHGGNDVGTHGPSGLLEKDVVLDVALKLGALLQDRLGADVVYTRSSDTYVGLEERTQIANDRKADLFLSIHANSSPYPSVGGVEAYYLNFTTSRSALDLAAKENASSQSTIFDLKEVLAKIAMKDKIDESREFASSVQTSLFALSSKNNTAAKNRGIKKAPFVVLIGASMPSVLAEIGFLTNATDEALLKKPEHREKIAEALYKGIASYADSLSHFQVAKRE